MKWLHLLGNVLTACFLCANQAQAATVEFSFSERIISFPSGFTSASQITDTETLSTPYASMVIADAPTGIDMTFNINGAYAGWLKSVGFDYIPQLASSGISLFWPGSSPTPPENQAYYFSNPGGVNGLGTGYSVPSWQPSSTLMQFSYGNPFGDSISVYFRNLPDGISAESFKPQYLAVAAAGWGNAGDASAYVLPTSLSPVPVPASAQLFFVGFLLLVVTTTRSSWGQIGRS